MNEFRNKNSPRFYRRDRVLACTLCDFQVLNALKNAPRGLIISPRGKKTLSSRACSWVRRAHPKLCSTKIYLMLDYKLVQFAPSQYKSRYASLIDAPRAFASLLLSMHYYSRYVHSSFRLLTVPCLA
jgi:hypothetical protein